MLTAQDAYDRIMDFMSDFSGTVVYDYGSFYAMDDGLEGDTGYKNSFKVDKVSGEVSDFPFDELMDALRKLGDAEDPQPYVVPLNKRRTQNI